jgi:hypothetical protein
MQRGIAIGAAVVAFVILWLLALEWLAEDACLDRGGQILANNICSNGEDPPWKLYSLIHPIGAAIMAVIVAILVALSTGGIYWAMRRRGKRDA